VLQDSAQFRPGPPYALNEKSYTADFTPLRPTPPDQDYASGHAIEGGAAAEVLKQVFGTDGISFQDCGVKLPAGSTCADPSPKLRSDTSTAAQRIRRIARC
jgi:hypothetical protein